MKKKTALTTAMVALPFAMAPGLQAQDKPAEEMTPVDRPSRAARPVPSRELCCLKFAERYDKHSSTYTIVGTDKEHPVYQNVRDEYFYLDPETGDMIFLEPDAFVKWRPAAPEKPSPAPLKMWKRVVKAGEQVTVLGFDREGHVVQQNVRGEAFYLDPSTGDMIFVK
jgi:hypothetical protein